MRQLTDTRDIFAQLADTDGSSGVEMIVENHDAWVNNDAVMGKVSAAMRVQLARTPRPERVTQQISRQRSALAGLVTTLPARLSNAG
jgi:hypothetical protein